METWRLLAGVCILLVVWAGLVSALGYQIGPVEIVGATVLGVCSFYLAEMAKKRIASR